MIFRPQRSIGTINDALKKNNDVYKNSIKKTLQILLHDFCTFQNITPSENNLVLQSVICVLSMKTSIFDHICIYLLKRKDGPQITKYSEKP